MPPPSHNVPPSRAASRDLTDGEFAELDELLATTPEPLEPCDAVMLDGFLCGVLVQPVLLAPEAWLPYVFDFDGRPLPDDVDSAWHERVQSLILRRHAALNRAVEEDGWFHPLILELDEEADESAGVAAGGEGPAPAPSASAEPVDAVMAGLSPISQAVMPWVAGFQHATQSFPDLVELPDEAVMVAMARLYRHLPVETDDERELVATLDREQPLATLDDAIEELVVTVADLADLTRDQRYKVDTVKRDQPKVGRNDPCPCGSGKKFKQCHGAT